MTNYKDYREGQDLVYYESGFMCLVRVIESKGDEKYEKYFLMVTGLLQPGSTKPITLGRTFECSKLRESSHSLWCLEEVVDEDITNPFKKER